jgi:hypothetical protein
LGTTEYFHGIGKYSVENQFTALALRMAKYAPTTTCYCLDSFHCEQIDEKLNKFGSLNKIPMALYHMGERK